MSLYEKLGEYNGGKENLVRKLEARQSIAWLHNTRNGFSQSLKWGLTRVPPSGGGVWSNAVGESGLANVVRQEEASLRLGVVVMAESSTKKGILMLASSCPQIMTSRCKSGVFVNRISGHRLDRRAQAFP